MIQRARSTNWKAAVVGSNSTHSTIDSAKTISEVDSAMLRALRATIASSPRASMMNATPTSGRKVTSDKSGQWLMPRPRRSIRSSEHHPHPALPHRGGGFSAGRAAKPSPSMGEGWVGVTDARIMPRHRGSRYQVTSATTPISMAKA